MLKSTSRILEGLPVCGVLVEPRIGIGWRRLQLAAAKPKSLSRTNEALPSASINRDDARADSGHVEAYPACRK